MDYFPYAGEQQFLGYIRANIRQLSVRQNSDLAWATAQRVPLMVNTPSRKAIEDIEAIARWVVKETVVKEENNGETV